MYNPSLPLLNRSLKKAFDPIMVKNKLSYTWGKDRKKNILPFQCLSMGVTLYIIFLSFFQLSMLSRFFGNVHVHYFYDQAWQMLSLKEEEKYWGKVQDDFVGTGWKKKKSQVRWRNRCFLVKSLLGEKWHQFGLHQLKWQIIMQNESTFRGWTHTGILSCESSS